MNRPLLALGALFVYFALALAGRMVWHWRRTGRHGYLGVPERPLSLPWWSGASLVLGSVVAVGGLLLEAFGRASGVRAPEWSLAVGLPAAALGTYGTVLAQSTMGASWRIGVHAAERTELITDGIFALVRNPIFSFLLLTMAGVAAIAPGVATFAAFGLFLLGVQLQVRFVEEPYLRRVHGASYAQYCARVGRFFPGAGRVATMSDKAARPSP